MLLIDLTARQAVDETLLCMGTQGPGTKPEVLMRLRVSATFIEPLLAASPTALHFAVRKTTNEAMACVEQTLQLTNVSPLPLTALLSCTAPFELVSGPLAELAPQATGTVVVRYDPNQQQDSHSRVDTGRLVVRFREHPQLEHIELAATVSFPNIVLSTDHIDFGCIVNNTSAHQRVTMSNPGALPVVYRWALFDDGSASQASQVIVILHSCPALCLVFLFCVSNLHQIVDILPIEGCIEPNSTCVADVLFHGTAECRIDTVAICSVVDGPRCDNMLSLPLLFPSSPSRFLSYLSLLALIIPLLFFCWSQVA